MSVGGKVLVGLSLAVASGLYLSADAAPLSGALKQPTSASLVEKTQSVYFNGRRYCFYADGWQGPGWYWCGYRWRQGYGWGGAPGWHGWRHPPVAGFRGPTVRERGVRERGVREERGFRERGVTERGARGGKEMRYRSEPRRGGMGPSGAEGKAGPSGPSGPSMQKKGPPSSMGGQGPSSKGGQTQPQKQQ